MSTAALIKSIQDHAVRQRGQLDDIYLKMHVLVEALVAIVQVVKDTPTGSEKEVEMRMKIGEIAVGAVRSVNTPFESEPV